MSNFFLLDAINVSHHISHLHYHRNLQLLPNTLDLGPYVTTVAIATQHRTYAESNEPHDHGLDDCLLFSDSDCGRLVVDCDVCGDC
jgi:hypothetical protein